MDISSLRAKIEAEVDCTPVSSSRVSDWIYDTLLWEFCGLRLATIREEIASEFQAFLANR